jgi:hypothetical protein
MAILGFVVNSGARQYLRYALPVLPFAHIWVGKMGQSHICKRWTTSVAVVGCLAWMVVSSLVVFPHSLSYGNELAGGPRHGHKHFSDCDIDWGQDLFYLKEWLDKHPGVKLNGLGYLGSFRPTVAGIPKTARPAPGPSPERHRFHQSEDQLGPGAGWYALSVNYLYHRTGQYRYFLDFKPAAMAGYSIYIYHITLEDANHVRRELGLPELPREWGDADLLPATL